MKFQLNRKSAERLKAHVRAGDYVDTPWSFTVADSNALLDDPPNWTEYQLWMLGIQIGNPDSVSPDKAQEQSPQKEGFAYPFGNGKVANLNALRAIANAASDAGENDIADAATQALAVAMRQDADRKTATGKASARDITLTAAANLKAADPVNKLPTFDADAYTGAAMNLDGWNHPVVVDYDGIDVTNHARPVLRDHDATQPLGHTTGVAVENGVLKARGVISASGKHVDEVVDAAKQGFPWQVSIGSKVHKSEFVPEGKTAQANGKTWPGPVYIARHTSLREISFLTLGADDNTSARIAAKSAKGIIMKKKFAAWAKARNLKMADMGDDAVAKAAKSIYKAETKHDADDPADVEDDGKDDDNKDGDAGASGKDGKSAATAPDIRASAAGQDVVKEMRAAALGERQRMTAITAALDDHRKTIEPKKFADIEAKAISGEYDVTRVELECIKAARPTMNAPMINTGAGGQADGQIIAAASARSMGIDEKVAFKGLDERAGNIAASMRGFTIHQIIAASAARLGMHVSPGGIDDDFLGGFLRADRASHRQQWDAYKAANPMIRASSGSGFSTMSLTGITENIMNKAMLEQYGLQLSVIDDIAFSRDTNDFRPFKVYRLTASGDLQPVGPGGEIKTISLQDESYSNQVRTQAALLVLKREDIVNDDMGSLTQAPQIVGRKGALNREKQVVTAFLSGLSTLAPGPSVGKPANTFNFFSTGAKNYLNGAGSALGIGSLQNAVTKYLQQTDDNGDPVMIAPDRLLVGPENKAVAENLFNGANLTVGALDLPAQTGGTSAAQSNKQVVNYNQHAGKYRPIVSPFLGGASPIAGASATQWALLGNPAGGTATVQIGYLRGQRTPMIRQVDTDAIMLGVAYQIIFDFGVALLDYRTGVYSAGA